MNFRIFHKVHTTYSQLAVNPDYRFARETNFGVVLLDARVNIISTSAQEIHTVIKIIII